MLSSTAREEVREGRGQARALETLAFGKGHEREREREEERKKRRSEVMKNGGPSPLWLLVAAIGLHLSGCASHDAIDYSSGFTTGVQQSDIPVPLNFRFDPNRGYDYQSYRTG